MVKRVKVSDEPREPRIFGLQVYCGSVARDEGKSIDDIECKLLRDPEMAASWRKGWTDRDAELAKPKKGKSR
jgi:hypothetical protein